MKLNKNVFDYYKTIDDLRKIGFEIDDKICAICLCGFTGNNNTTILSKNLTSNKEGLGIEKIELPVEIVGNKKEDEEINVSNMNEKKKEKVNLIKENQDVQIDVQPVQQITNENDTNINTTRALENQFPTNKKFFNILKEKTKKVGEKILFCRRNKEGKIIIMFTPCKHVFHQECLKEWMKVKRNCPDCRKDLPPYY